MSDYYELLGIDSDADKDSIKSAYRDRLEDASQSERAKLNKAWNVLSDPVQRERYDGARAEGWLDDAVEDDVEVVSARPARGSAAKGDGGGGGGGRKPRPPAAPRPEPDVALPEGMVLAENRAHGNALLIDFLILFVVYALALALVLPALVKSQYPAETKKIDAINKQIDSFDKQKSNVDKKADKAKGQAKKDLQSQSKQLQKKIDNKTSDVNDLSKHFQGYVMVLYGVLTVIMLLIVVPITALTGQTIGQRFRKVRVVRLDGSPVGWGGAILRFFPPIALAIFLPQIGALIGLGMVLWFLRDRNRQGFHDKLAKTLVVAAD